MYCQCNAVFFLTLNTLHTALTDSLTLREICWNICNG